MPAARPDAISAPIFVVTAARSGSTLLRFILDSHPDIACPPETDLGMAVGYLAHAWDVTARAASSRAGAAPGGITALPAEALGGLRASADGVLASYLRSTGKSRICDKSLSTVYHAGLLAQVYPDAMFVCLYRHCMDVIASYLAAMPWGLGSQPPGQPGFRPIHGFVARNPGDSVAALAEYWLDCARKAADFEAAHPGRCFRLRYEDLVDDPEPVTASLLSFLGAAPAAGLADACFRIPHDRGPSDPKIWGTRRVQQDSVGTGVAVPAARVPPAARAGINDVLAALGYRLVDDEWNAAGLRRDPRQQASQRIPA